MWHIPKTGGLQISLINTVLRIERIVPAFPNYDAELGVDLSFNYSYIQGHFGSLPIDNNPSLDTAILLRDPFDRSVSNFIWLYMENVLTEMEPYKSMTSMTEKLKYYLFEDETFLLHRNMQTRFLSNSISENTFKAVYGINTGAVSEYDTSGINIYINWFLPDTKTSLEMAKSRVDNATILGTTDDHNSFAEKILNWFIINYSLDLNMKYQEQTRHYKIKKTKNLENGLDPYVNYSNYTDSDGTIYTTESLKTLLTKEDIAQIYENNSLDKELYEYAKEKLQ
jgi:hypothetical protein